MISKQENIFLFIPNIIGRSKVQMAVFQSVTVYLINEAINA